VCNHRYTALCDESHGAAVLNDCKYGVGMLGNTISLTLLRAAAAPEMRTDNHTHRFTYAITAWEGSFIQSNVVREGMELNTPVLTSDCWGAQCVSAVSFFCVEQANNVIIDTIKPAEDGSGDLIVRLYESKRADCDCALCWSLPVVRAALTNMMERELSPLILQGGGVQLHFTPFEVKTVRLGR